MVGEPLKNGGEARVGLILSGGGARGAYEAGVLLYIRTDLAKHLGYQPQFDVITGTSVGAINATYLAATADAPETQAQTMCDNWRSLQVEKLIALKGRELLRAGMFWGKEAPLPNPNSSRYGGILDTTGLEEFVLRACPWSNIRKNLAAGKLRALAVSATHVGTGATVVFTETQGAAPTQWSRDPFVRHEPACIGPRHAMASAAIPLLFPAVRIGKSYYVDGGLRQNTPLAPAIRLGAERILVISLRYVNCSPDQQTSEEREQAYPKPLFLAGKALNALLLDHTDHDIDRMSRINNILAAGTAAFGPGFGDAINRELKKQNCAPLRPMHTVHIRPSFDIGALAAQFLSSGKVIISGRVAKKVFQTLAQGEARHESDLLSYLLFDGSYADELIRLGFADAAAHKDALIALFS